MRVVRLGKVVAQAETLRIRRLVQRTTNRAIYGAIAVVFVLFLLLALHVAAGLALAPAVGPVYATLIVAGVDLVIAAATGALAAFSSPGRIEQEAFQVREEARAQLAEAAVMTAVVGPVLRRAGFSLLSRLLQRGRPARRNATRRAA